MSYYPQVLQFYELNLNYFSRTLDEKCFNNYLSFLIVG